MELSEPRVVAFQGATSSSSKNATFSVESHSSEDSGHRATNDDKYKYKQCEDR